MLLVLDIVDLLQLDEIWSRRPVITAWMSDRTTSITNSTFRLRIWCRAWPASNGQKPGAPAAVLQPMILEPFSSR